MLLNLMCILTLMFCGHFPTAVEAVVIANEYRSIFIDHDDATTTQATIADYARLSNNEGIPVRNQDSSRSGQNIFIERIAAATSNATPTKLLSRSARLPAGRCGLPGGACATAEHSVAERITIRDEYIQRSLGAGEDHKSRQPPIKPRMALSKRSTDDDETTSSDLQVISTNTPLTDRAVQGWCGNPGMGCAMITTASGVVEDNVAKRMPAAAILDHFVRD